MCYMAYKCIASALTVLATQPVAVLVTELQLADGDASIMVKLKNVSTRFINHY